MEKEEKKLKEIKIDSWDKYKEEVKNYQSWAFRGQSDSTWKIESYLARHFKTFEVNKIVQNFQEERSIRIFKGKVHEFLKHIPDDNDTLQWLSIMQHFGSPTRLIDFSWSPYVAAFFALENTTKDSAVWAICSSKISEKNKKLAKNFNKDVNKVLDEAILNKCPKKNNFVLIAEPKIMNQRLSVQRGTFAITKSLDEGLEKVLVDYYDNNGDTIVKFILPKKIRKEAMLDLYNSNITNATLFPDIVGMAKSIAYELEFHWGFDAQKGKYNKGFDKSDYQLPKDLKQFSEY